ncbi:hypothetical protein [Mesotoga sp. BH458_6_3_2_1]|uniref:hypothetical protein n=1 Tax=Mesotoga sp. BH458_6_3_2_1 TaxID=1437446 RepID=UPI0015FEFF3F|nr:hypothetical protein [Mesotoga sp. BH458_6_3_2_1]
MHLLVINRSFHIPPAFFLDYTFESEMISILWSLIGLLDHLLLSLNINSIFSKQNHSISIQIAVHSDNILIDFYSLFPEELPDSVKITI